MTNESFYDETFVERDEMNYPASEYLDSEPLYSNFTAIQNATQHRETHQVRSFFILSSISFNHHDSFI